MNRKGFTAVMDAVFVIILLSMASALILQADFGGADDRRTAADTCDIIFESKMSQTVFGYGPDDRVMKVSDLAAASIDLGDGRISGFLRNTMDSIYPWEGAYCLILEHDGGRLELNRYDPDYTEKTVRTYPVEYGGELRVTLAVYR